MSTKEYRILRPGFAYFEIFEVSTKDKDGLPLKTKKGIPMIKLKLQVTDSEGSTETVYDYLIAQFMEKINQFKRCLNIDGDIYRVIDSMRYKSGYCTIKTQFAEPGSQWGDRTGISAYLPKDTVKTLTDIHNLHNEEPKTQATNSSKPVATQPDDSDSFDDIPF